MTEETTSNIHLRVSLDRMAVLLDCTLAGADLAEVLTQIELGLEKHKIPEAPSREELEARIRPLAQNRAELVDFVLLEGQPPTPPKDGTIAWAREFFSADFVVDEKTGAIDYRRRVGNPAVNDGELLAHVLPPVDGQSGRDVLGKTLPARKGKPARIRPGPNVREEKTEEETKYFASGAGRVRFAGGTLAVDNVYIIRGAVGLETGHVHHSGALVIEGDVLVGSRVTAAGDIEIHGLVEAADIEAGGNLVVHGGITGAPGRHIRVTGSVKAKFIQEADIRAIGDIAVQTGIIHSHLRARGALIMPTGRVTGGEVIAHRGITVFDAGSGGQVATVLIAGEDFALDSELAPLRQEMEQIEAKLDRIHAEAEPMLRILKRLSPEQRESVTVLWSQIPEMEARIQELQIEMHELRATSQARAVPRLVVRHIIFPDVRLRLSRIPRIVKSAYEGPLEAVISEGEVKLVPLATEERPKRA
jgi:uncharacterized protein (DUF342 family)